MSWTPLFGQAYSQGEKFKIQDLTSLPHDPGLISKASNPSFPRGTGRAQQGPPAHQDAQRAGVSVEMSQSFLAPAKGGEV